MHVKGNRVAVASYLRREDHRSLVAAAEKRDVSVAHVLREAVGLWLAADGLTSRVRADTNMAAAPTPPAPPPPAHATVASPPDQAMAARTAVGSATTDAPAITEGTRVRR